jgi:hypothetical protein
MHSGPSLPAGEFNMYEGHTPKSVQPELDASANNLLSSPKGSTWITVNQCSKFLEHCESKEWNESLLQLAVCEVYASESSARFHAEFVLGEMERLLLEEGHFVITKECREQMHIEPDKKMNKKKKGGKKKAKAAEVDGAPCDSDDAVALALCMALHPRLGASSPLARLDREIIAAIARLSRPPADAIYTTGLLRRTCRKNLEGFGGYAEGRYFGEEVVEFTAAEVAASNRLGQWHRAMEWACRAHPVEVRTRAPPAPAIALVDGWMCDVSERPGDWAGPGQWTNEALIYSGTLRDNMCGGLPVHDGGRTTRPPLPGY